MYYIYKIENIQNNKKYIGLTNNISRRRNRHFSDLKYNRHDNSFLQKEYNIYGKENFSFEIIYEGNIDYNEISEKEKYFIKHYDSYLNGYNQNEGGSFGPNNGGSHLVKSDIFAILAAIEFSSRPGQILSDIFNVSRTTISRIKKGINHSNIVQEYYNKSEEERKEIFEIFSQSVNFLEKKVHQTIIKSKRKLTKDQVFMIFVNEEYNIVPKIYFCKRYDIQNNTIYTILSHKSYKDYYYEYQNLTFNQKEQLASLLRNQQKQTS